MSRLRKTATDTTASDSAVILLRVAEVSRRTGLPRSSIYGLVRTGQFPRPLQLSRQTVAWRSDAIAAWIDQLPVHDAATR